MSLLSPLSSLALRPCLSAISIAAEVAGCSFAKGGVEVVRNYFVNYFTDQSQELQKALLRSTDRAWTCLEVALGGRKLFGFFTRLGDDKEFDRKLQRFLDANPMHLPQGDEERLRHRALMQLRAGRKSKTIPGTLDLPSLTTQLAEFVRYTEPAAVYEAEGKVLAEVIDRLRRAGHDALAAIVGARYNSGEVPLLTNAVRLCFRTEVEANPRLFRGMMHEQVQRLRHDMDAVLNGIRRELAAGFDGLLVLLQHDRRRLDKELTEFGYHLGKIESNTEEICDGLTVLQEKIDRLNEKFERFLNRDIRPEDSRSIHTETDCRLAVQRGFR